ncbi:MAG TPA: immunoglobulin-like domain-containing protein [Solirubrobacterales bacterium]|nr:immunoglobulin-like domain-containing protein [Solirubrobacterales bacterium]
MAIAAALVLLFSTIVAGRAAAVEYDPEPAFCKQAIVPAPASPFARMPKLHQPSKNGRIGFGPSHLRLWSTPHVLVGKNLVGFTLGLEQRQGLSLPWTAKVTIVEVNAKGHPTGKPRRMIRRVGWLKPPFGDAFQFVVPEDPAFYRATILLTGASGQKLGKFSSYTRVVEPTAAARLVLNASTYQPESTVFMRVDNPGDLTVVYGVNYRVEKLEGDTWVTAPESPRGPTILIAYASLPGSSGRCMQFQAPGTMASGTYRIAKEVRFTFPFPPPLTKPIAPAPKATLTAEFQVVP